MNYKLKEFEDEFSDVIVSLCGTDRQRIARIIKEYYENAEYKNFDVYFSSILYYASSHKFRRIMSEYDFYENSVFGRIDKQTENDTNYSDKQLMILVKYSFIKAYGKSYIDMMKEFE